MAGLFDIGGIDPQTAGLMSMGMRLMSTPGNFGRAFGTAGIGALEDYYQAATREAAMKRAAEQDKLMELQRQQLMAQMAAAEKARKDAERQQEIARGHFREATPEITANYGGGLIQPAAEAGYDFPGLSAGLAREGYFGPALEIAEKAKKAVPTPVVVPKGAVMRHPVTGEMIGEPTPDTEAKGPNDWEVYKLATQPPYTAERFQAWLIDKSERSRPDIKVVNAGQTGFENMVSAKKMFAAEPAYKALEDMKLAHKSVIGALKQETPIADTAAASKIMRLIDPGSVVRESELGMAMAAAGKMDRIANYVDMWKTGKKLTPQQRLDFAGLANELYEAAAQAYNDKRTEYKTLLDYHKLPVDTVLGAQAPSLFTITGKRAAP